MDVRHILKEAAQADRKRALPILSFPAVQKMNVTVEQLVKSADLQAQAMEIIAHQTDTLAAVSLMDLSVEAEAFGANVRFSATEVPCVTGQLVASLEDAEALAVPPLTAGRAAVCAEGVRLAKELITDKPVLAGMIGPYSLAGRLMDVTEIMYTCYDEPETVHAVLEKATAYLIAYGQLLKSSGADGVLVAEPLAGILSPDMASAFSVPYVKRIIEALQDDGFAVLYHNCGNAVLSMLDAIFSQGAVAYHFGNAVDMAAVLRAAPADAICLGNLSPAGVFVQGTALSVTTATHELMRNCSGFPNFIPSSGCDIPAHADWKNINAFFAALEK